MTTFRSDQNRSHAMQQSPDINRSLRDDGAAAALKNAGHDWHDKAMQLATEFFAQVGHAGALFEDVREFATLRGVPHPPSPNAWGAVFLAMSKRKLIIKTGELRASKATKSHARAQPVWRQASIN